MALFDVAAFKVATLMPGGDVDALETDEAGYLARRIALREAKMNARLAKRYAVPFDPASPPDAAFGWLVDQVTLDAYMKRGFNPSSAQDGLIEKNATTADAEILEAANSETGLFDLPLRQDAPTGSGVSRGGPFGYSESSPYVAFDRQVDTARDEDANRSGS